MMEENLFVNVVSCKACSFTVFCLKKFHTHIYIHIYTHTRTHTKNIKRVTPEWTDILDGPGLISFLSESSMYYITQTLHNPINLLNVVSTNSFSWASILHLLHGVQTRWDGWNWSSKPFQSKSICFSSLLSRVNKAIFVWVYELENNGSSLLYRKTLLLVFYWCL